MKTLKVFGPPGTGKTTALLKLFDEELKTVKPSRIGFMTFTRAARAEVLSRTELPEDELPFVKTIHATCYKILNIDQSQLVSTKDIRAFGTSIGVQLSGYMPDLFSLEAISEKFQQPTKADRLLQLNHLGRHRGLTLRETLKDAPVELDFNYAKWFTQAYRNWKTSKGKLDYTDLLTEYLERHSPLDLDVLFVDEAQDLSWLQWQVVRKFGANCQRTYLAGDDDQCQPAGEKVLTPTGEVDISSLKVGDQVIPYVSGAGFFGRQRILETSSRPFIGKMYSISAGGFTTRCTPNHKWLVKWLPESGKKFVTYLMRRGSWFRLGQCKLKRNDNVDGVYTNANELQVRCRVEQADEVWILKVHDTRREARMDEALNVVKYGIPDLCLESGDITFLHDFFNKAATSIENVIRCLEDHNLYLDYPLWKKGSRVKTGYNTAFKVEACNIISGLMSIPVYAQQYKPIHSKVSVSIADFSGLVYSLNVSKYHSYVSNNLATLNSIFTWAGASASMFNLEPCDDIRVLPRSYRLPRVVHELSQRIIKQVKVRQEKEFVPRDEEGEYVPVGQLDIPHVSQGKTLVLYRNFHRGGALSTQLEDLGVPFTGINATLSNSDILSTISGLRKVLRHEPIPMSEARSLVQHASISVLLENAKETVDHKNGEVSATSIFKDPGKFGLYELSRILPKLPRLAYLQRTLSRYGIDAALSPSVQLMSIHQSKGREADTVVLDLELARRTYEAYQREPDDEHRVYYVAVTRAKHRLLTLLPTDSMTYVM